MDWGNTALCLGVFLVSVGMLFSRTKEQAIKLNIALCSFAGLSLLTTQGYLGAFSQVLSIIGAVFALTKGKSFTIKQSMMAISVLVACYTLLLVQGQLHWFSPMVIFTFTAARINEFFIKGRWFFFGYLCTTTSFTTYCYLLGNWQLALAESFLALTMLYKFLSYKEPALISIKNEA